MADDLDALLRDLSSAAKPQAAPALPPRAQPQAQPQAQPASKQNNNELDDLIANLSASSPQQQRAPPPQTAPKKDVADDLDNLMASLSNPAPKTAARPAQSTPQAQPKPAEQKPTPQKAASDDLDSLMASLASSGPKTTTRPPPPQNSQRAAADDLDSLMASLSTGPKAATKPAAPAQPQQSPAQKKVASNELDNLLESLSSSTPQKQAEPQKASGSLDQLLGQLSSKPAASASSKSDNLDSLLNNLNAKSSEMASNYGSTGTSQGICGKCGGAITGQIIQALGKSYHPEHFTCGVCQKALGTSTFFDVGGAPQCESCFKSLSCPKCGHCDQPIVDRFVSALGKKWHPEHFICAQCLSPFQNGAFFERDGRPYCEKDFFAMFAFRCTSCNEAIRGECVTALGSKWHPEHFNCQYCHQSFPDGSFFEYQGKPYCELHFHQMSGSLCSGCGKAVGSRALNALGRKWHPEHFVCAFCMNPLAGASFKEDKGKPYCSLCFSKLFG